MNRKMKITINIYLFFVLFGIAKTIIGPVMPHLINDYSVTLGTAGLLLSLLSFGRLLSVSWATVWLDKVGPDKILILGALCITGGLAGFALSVWWSLHLLFIVLIGIGFGFLGTSSNALIAGIYVKEQGNALNRMHMFFGIGSLLGPIGAGLLLYRNYSWRIIFGLAFIFSLISLLWAFFQNIPEINNKEEAEDNSDNKFKIRLKKLVHSPLFFLLAVIMFVYIGVGNGLIGWMNKYLGDTFAFSDFFASGFLAIYTLGITSGRFVYSYISDNLGYKKSILLGAVGSFISITVAVFSSTSLIILLGFGFTGFFLAGLFPTCIAYGSRVFPEMLGTISSALIFSSVLGGIIVPYIMGIISEFYGLRGGMITTVIFSIFLVIASGLLFKFDY
ncbi:MAG: MFS transporter [Bacillota bacterium]